MARPDTVIARAALLAILYLGLGLISPRKRLPPTLASISRRLATKEPIVNMTPSSGIVCAVCEPNKKRQATVRCFFCLDALCPEHFRMPFGDPEDPDEVEACEKCAVCVTEATREVRFSDNGTVVTASLFFVDAATADAWRAKYASIA